jgi:hypothetical protein
VPRSQVTLEAPGDLHDSEGVLGLPNRGGSSSRGWIEPRHSRLTRVSWPVRGDPSLVGLTRSWGGQGIADVWRWGSPSIHFKPATGMRTTVAPSPVLKKIAETGSPVIRINPETAEVTYATVEVRTREHRGVARARV